MLFALSAVMSLSSASIRQHLEQRLAEQPTGSAAMGNQGHDVPSAPTKASDVRPIYFTWVLAIVSFLAGCVTTAVLIRARWRWRRTADSSPS